MTYKLFIQVDRDGVVENLFFETIEELITKKDQLDAEIATQGQPAETGESSPAGEGEPEATPAEGSEEAPAV